MVAGVMLPEKSKAIDAEPTILRSYTRSVICKLAIEENGTRIFRGSVVQESIGRFR